MRQITEWINTHIGFDGLLHITVSALICCLFKHIIGGTPAVCLTCIFGLGKEFYDKYTGKGTSELKDLICDSFGILIGVLWHNNIIVQWQKGVRMFDMWVVTIT